MHFYVSILILMGQQVRHDGRGGRDNRLDRGIALRHSLLPDLLTILVLLAQRRGDKAIKSINWRGSSFDLGAGSRLAFEWSQYLVAYSFVF